MTGHCFAVAHTVHFMYTGINLGINVKLRCLKCDADVITEADQTEAIAEVCCLGDDSIGGLKLHLRLGTLY